MAKAILNLPIPFQQRDAWRWLRQAYHGFEAGTCFTFAIRLTTSGQFVGGISLRVSTIKGLGEVGYWLGEPYWCQGLATEALTALIAFGFEKIGLEKIAASHHVGNHASGRVMAKCGMVMESNVRPYRSAQETHMELINYQMTKQTYDEWSACKVIDGTGAGCR